MPDNERNDLDEFAAGDVLNEFSMPPDTLVSKLLYWAPVAFFGISMIFLVVTIFANPAGRHERPREPQYYYDNATRALDMAHDTTQPQSHRDLERAFNVARINLTRLLRHYGSSISEMPQYGNPYLLLADTNRELAAITPPTEFRTRLLEEGQIAYMRALQLEEAQRSDKMKVAWDNQYLAPGAITDTPEKELALRKERRRWYIEYHQALIDIELLNPLAALQRLQDLRNIFGEAELERMRNERDGIMAQDLDIQLPPKMHELLPEDKILADYYLSRAYDMGNMPKEAQDQYRIFLLRAPVGLERLLAQMRLAEMASHNGNMIRHVLAMGGQLQKGVSLDDARKKFEDAAALYAAVVESSPPESIRDEAYFRGGQAYLVQAAMMQNGSLTWWDATEEATGRVQSLLESFSGLPLPRRTALLPASMGASLLENVSSDPMAVFTPLEAVSGGLITLATNRRITPQERRNRLLSKARSFFDGASRKPEGRFTPDSQVMIGKSLLIGGQISDARKTLDIARKRYGSMDVQIGATQGIAESYLQEGLLDNAWHAFMTIPKQQNLPVTPLVSAEEIAEDLQKLGHAYVEKANALQYFGAAPETQPLRDELRARLEQRQHFLSRATEVYEFLLSSFQPQMRDEVLVNLAHLYAQQAEDLTRAPFGFSADLQKASTLRATAGRTYYRVTEETPNSSRIEEALLAAGQLFHQSNHHERAVESLKKFAGIQMHSERITYARNIMGLSYRALGLYDDAIKAFRENGYESTTAEGRKALFYLGETLLQRGGEYLGGPGSELNHPLTPQQQRDPSCLRIDDIRNWQLFLARVYRESTSPKASPGLRIWENLSPRTQELISTLNPNEDIPNKTLFVLLRELNRILALPNLYDAQAWEGITIDQQTEQAKATFLAQKSGMADMSISHLLTRMNHLLLLAAYPNDMVMRDLEVVPEDASMRIPQTAREVFGYIRSLSGLSPDSRPWRWSTFSLGETFFRIATNLERSQTDADAAAGSTAETYYRRAVELLTEALDRYPLYPQTAWGLHQSEAPEDYDDIRRQTFIALYQLGVAHVGLHQEAEAQKCFEGIINEKRFDEDFIAREELQRPSIRTMYEQAFLLLGLSLYRNNEYDLAFSAFAQAHDRLKNADTPYAIHMMGECQIARNNLLDARRMFVMAENAARNAPASQMGGFVAEYGNAFWRNINNQRLKDLEYLRTVEPRMTANE